MRVCGWGDVYHNIVEKIYLSIEFERGMDWVMCARKYPMDVSLVVVLVWVTVHICLQIKTKQLIAERNKTKKQNKKGTWNEWQRKKCEKTKMCTCQQLDHRIIVWQTY